MTDRIGASETVIANHAVLADRIKAACRDSGRDLSEVLLMAVSKMQSAQAVEEVLALGLRVMGENRVQEAAEKRNMVCGKAKWELIGPLQSNKVKLAVETFERIQTVDRIKLVERLDRVVRETGRVPYPVLMQVNIGEDPAKHGCHETEAEALMEAMLSCGSLQVDGLMTIGQFTTDEGILRRTFSGLRELRERLRASSGLALPVLSMGMSGDLEIAIGEGSTLIRVGTALFGQRP